MALVANQQEFLMKKVLTLIIMTISTMTFAEIPSSMGFICHEKLYLALGEGPLEMSTPEIIDELETDWKANPSKETAQFSYCGRSEFFKIVVDKASCEIIELSGGKPNDNCDGFSASSATSLEIPTKDLIAALKTITTDVEVKGTFECTLVQNDYSPRVSLCLVSVNGSTAMIENAEEIIAIAQKVKKPTGPYYSANGAFETKKSNNEIRAFITLE